MLCLFLLGEVWVGYPSPMRWRWLASYPPMVSPDIVLLELLVTLAYSPWLGVSYPIWLHACFSSGVLQIEWLLCLSRCVHFRLALRPGKLAGIDTNNNWLIAGVLF